MRKRVYLPFLAFALICAAWSGLWKFTADSVDAGLDDWFQDERSAGRIWACADRKLGGYPFRIELSCRSPSFTATVDGLTTLGRLGDLIAVANAYQPNLVIAEAKSPLTVQRGDLQVNLAWEGLRISHHTKQGELVQTALEFDKPVLNVAKNGPAIEFLHADRVEFYAQPAVQAGALEMAIRAARASVPTADQLSGEGDTMDVIARALITGGGLLQPAPLRGRLEAWRQTGGTFEVAELKIAKGPARIEATGKFGLDAAHRPQGKLDLLATGLEPILKRLGIPTAAVAIGSALSAFLPGSKGLPPATEGPGNQLKLPLTIANGRLSVGPVRTPLLVPPLY